MKVLNQIGRAILNKYVIKKRVCIISNDCYGGEIYRWLNIPYNTPFIGLMIMAPCYIKLLTHLEYYLAKDILFIERSKYVEMNDFNLRNNNYPIGLIEDIEIHFLHYKNNEEAITKWKRRVGRIDWNNLYFKFSSDKDYAEYMHLKQFHDLGMQFSLSISNKEYREFSNNIFVPNNVLDATVTFGLSLKYFNLISWLNEGRVHFKGLKERLLGILLYLLLRR